MEPTNLAASGVGGEVLNLGVPPHVVQAIARHADVKGTFKGYAHANLDGQLA
ncbi:hypothetical protein ACPFP2_22335 [Micromonospora citrea]|uniref:hypothetical protein n=1 Tax=Micromonospora citrea TaxID=47855 RepID=UPI003C566677